MTDVFTGILRFLRTLTLPGGLLLLLVCLAAHRGVFPGAEAAVWQWLPLVFCGATALLGWRFNRSRVVFASLTLLLGAAGLSLADSEGARLIAVLVPLNLAAFGLIRERGIFTLRGIVRLLLIGAEAALCWGYMRGGLPRLDTWLAAAPLSWNVVADLPFTQPVTAGLAFALLLLFVRFVRQRSPIESGLFWTIPAWGGVLVSPLPALWISTAACVLLMAIVEASYSMAFRDELTGLPARRAQNEYMLKLSGTYTMAMVDIDFFKKFNDRYGHDVGDQVLRMVATRLGRVTGGGKAFRYGGEEFTVIFPGKTVTQAEPHLERLREAVAQSGFTLRSRRRPRKKPETPRPSRQPRKQVSVTISIGVAERRNGQKKAKEVLKAADKALYRAKKAGRNRVAT